MASIESEAPFLFIILLLFQGLPPSTVFVSAEICKTPVYDGVPISCDLYKGFPYNQSHTDETNNVNYCVSGDCRINADGEIDTVCGVSVNSIKDCDARPWWVILLLVLLSISIIIGFSICFRKLLTGQPVQTGTQIMQEPDIYTESNTRSPTE